MPKNQIEPSLMLPASTGGLNVPGIIERRRIIGVRAYRTNKKLACALAFVLLAGCVSDEQLRRDWLNEKLFVKGFGWLPRAEAIELHKAGRIPDVEGLDD